MADTRCSLHGCRCIQQALCPPSLSMHGLESRIEVNQSRNVAQDMVSVYTCYSLYINLMQMHIFIKPSLKINSSSFIKFYQSYDS